MGNISSAATVYAKAYLTEKGRELLFNKGNSRFDASGNDLFEIKTFSVADPDINYNLDPSYYLKSGQIPDLAGFNSILIKATKYSNEIQTKMIVFSGDLSTKAYDNELYTGDDDQDVYSSNATIYATDSNDDKLYMPYTKFPVTTVANGDYLSQYLYADDQGATVPKQDRAYLQASIDQKGDNSFVRKITFSNIEETEEEHYIVSGLENIGAFKLPLDSTKYIRSLEPLKGVQYGIMFYLPLASGEFSNCMYVALARYDKAFPGDWGVYANHISGYPTYSPYIPKDLQECLTNHLNEGYLSRNIKMSVYGSNSNDAARSKQFTVSFT